VTWASLMAIISWETSFSPVTTQYVVLAVSLSRQSSALQWYWQPVLHRHIGLYENTKCWLQRKQNGRCWNSKSVQKAKPKPTVTCKNCSCLSAFHSVLLWCTIQRRKCLIIFMAALRSNGQAIMFYSCHLLLWPPYVIGQAIIHHVSKKRPTFDLL